MRVAIYGNSGSGKTTLADWLAHASGAPVLDLDTIAWQATAVRRPLDESRALLGEFVDGKQFYVIEGCYGDLIEAALAWQPVLIFLNPGVDACVEHCQARPWEPHKYASPEEQNERLAFLLDWVREYYDRADDMSLSAHQALFDDYEGEKICLDAAVDLNAPPASVERLLECVE